MLKKSLKVEDLKDLSNDERFADVTAVSLHIKRKYILVNYVN